MIHLNIPTEKVALQTIHGRNVAGYLPSLGNNWPVLYSLTNDTTSIAAPSIWLSLVLNHKTALQFQTTELSCRKYNLISAWFP